MFLKCLSNLVVLVELIIKLGEYKIRNRETIIEFEKLKLVQHSTLLYKGF